MHTYKIMTHYTILLIIIFVIIFYKIKKIIQVFLSFILKRIVLTDKKTDTENIEYLFFQN